MTVANIGGSLSCLKNIKLAFSNLGYILQSGQPNMIQELANTYNVCSTNTSSITDPMNQKMFLESFWGLFPLQSNDPSCEGEYCNYEKICELFEKPVNPDKSLLALYKALTAGSNECLDISWNEMIESMKSPDNSDRSWFYQTCKEFGFYQTCDPGTFCPFTTSPHVSTVESYLEICEEVSCRQRRREVLRSLLLVWFGWGAPTLRLTLSLSSPPLSLPTRPLASTGPRSRPTWRPPTPSTAAGTTMPPTSSS